MMFRKVRVLIMLLVSLVSVSACFTTPTSQSTTSVTVQTDQEIVQAFADSLTLGIDMSNVTQNLVLPVDPNHVVSITWTSSNSDVITSGGVVTPSVDGVATVYFTATVRLNDASAQKTFTLTVPVGNSRICPNLENPSPYEIANAGFENGDLCGWTPTGEQFKSDYVLNISTFWTGGSYNKDGEYFFTSNDHEGDLGTLSSRPFELGGSGWISFKLGAAKHPTKIYFSVMKTNETVDVEDDVEVARFGNTEFNDSTKTANMIQYAYNLSEFLGEQLYVKIVDNATSDWGWISMDSFFMYYEDEEDVPADAVVAMSIKPIDIDCATVTAETQYDIINGGFDVSQLCGWTTEGEAFTNEGITMSNVVWSDKTSTPEGTNLYSNWGFESKTGSMTSSTFVIGGSGFMTFRLGGAKVSTNLYVSVYLEDGTEIARYGNSAMDLAYIPIMITYKADLSGHLGERAYIKVVDNGTTDWGWLVIDSIKTYYPTTDLLPTDAVKANDKLHPDEAAPVLTGSFATMYVQVNGSEPDWLVGITANDEIDGDLTDEIEIDKGTFDISIVGEYTITYSITDSANLTTSKERTISVISDSFTVSNSSFETGDFTGWTATGDAFTLITNLAQEWGGTTFSIDGTYYFNAWKQGDAGQVGEAGTGTLTSSIFKLGGSGYVSFQLGAAKVTDNMYVSFYLVDGTEIARFGNTLFNNNPQMYTYMANLSEYIGENMYIKVVDNQTSDWGIFLFDAFNTYYPSVDDLPESGVVANSLFEPANNSFEAGDFDGWTATGDAFTLVTATLQEWFGTTYPIDGAYYFNAWKQGDAGGAGETGTGTLTSSTFTLSGSGYVTFMLGGGKVTENMYISFYLADGTEVARYGNSRFADNPQIYTFIADLSTFVGEKMYIKVVDNQTSDWGIFLFDAFKTYYPSVDDLPEGGVVANNVFEPVNNSFETGDLTGWTATGDAFSAVTNLTQEWGGTIYPIDGTYYFNTWKQSDAGGVGEAGIGTLTSSTFTLSGSGNVTFMLGAGKVTTNMYVSFFLADGTEVARYGNTSFANNPQLFTFSADLSDYVGEKMYIKIVDNQITDWGIFLFDAFKTFYVSADDLPVGVVAATDLLVH